MFYHDSSERFHNMVSRWQYVLNIHYCCELLLEQSVLFTMFSLLRLTSVSYLNINVFQTITLSVNKSQLNSLTKQLIMKIVTQPNESDLRDEVRGAVKCHFTHYESPHNLH